MEKNKIINSLFLSLNKKNKKQLEKDLLGLIPKLSLSECFLYLNLSADENICFKFQERIMFLINQFSFEECKIYFLHNFLKKSQYISSIL